MAVQAYITFLETSPDSFPDDMTGLVYDSCTFDRTFRNLRYWRICYFETRRGSPTPYHLCEIRVEESGRIVYPFGCI